PTQCRGRATTAGPRSARRRHRGRKPDRLGIHLSVSGTNWLLTREERGNPHTAIDSRHEGFAWTVGNEVRALVHGAAYFKELLRRIEDMRAGDVVMFTD